MNIKPQNTENKKYERRKPKAPKKITPSYLHNSGLYYLQRFTSSSENFRRVMMRKVKKSCRHHTDQDLDTCAEMVNTLIEQFVEMGLLNDDLYTKGVVTSLRRNGKSRRAIIMKLRSKGLTQDKIEHFLEEYDHEIGGNETEAEQIAAITFARKKRFGPFTREKETPHEKALASMARAGFSYDVCKKTLEMNLEDAEEKLRKHY